MTALLDVPRDPRLVLMGPAKPRELTGGERRIAILVSRIWRMQSWYRTALSWSGWTDWPGDEGDPDVEVTEAS